jgi:hypothetical protein
MLLYYVHKLYLYGVSMQSLKVNVWSEDDIVGT